MIKTGTLSYRMDQFGRRHPGLMWLAVGFLMLFVTLVLVMATDAPVVLYQTF
jgi:hypothetical protein